MAVDVLDFHQRAASDRPGTPPSAKAGSPFVTILGRIASRIGAELLVEPTFRIAGQITFKSGKKVFFRKKFFDINPLGSLEVGRDKYAASFFLKKSGFKVPDELAFSRPHEKGDGKPRLEEAIEFAKSIGFPVIVKPNLLTRGMLVTKVYDEGELRDAAAKVFQRDDIALVQRFYPLRDYRLVVFDDRVVSGYQRFPLTITGDGTSTLRQLLVARQLEIARDNSDIDLEVDDFRIEANARRAGLSLDSVPERGRAIQLLDNGNLSNGGSGVDVTGKIAAEFVKLAVEVTASMNLRLCGVDLLADDIARYSDNHVVLEINGAQGYPNVGEVPEEVIEELYFEVLKTLEQS
jgi:D-alanine-D-alanine ligase-like ATP-grasp enzyme